MSDKSRLELKPGKSSSGLRIEYLQVPEGFPFSGSRFYLKPGEQSMLDVHMDKEMWVFQSGNGDLFVDGVQYKAAAGDTFYFESNQGHYAVNSDPKEELVINSYWWLADSNRLAMNPG
jgi:oxalate decarboxylase/phosphoglucose isomerase-like protein (cupin superfamily)